MQNREDQEQMSHKKPNNNEKLPTKEELLADIEKLLQYDEHDKETINPKLLAYLDIDTLISTKRSLLGRVGILSSADREWLEQFKRYE
ncbi:MAG: hypothetical protein U9R27_09695 [Campylobacterota bacterium]|nr:hypothetical protein [Campylobacterota bacterium]